MLTGLPLRSQNSVKVRFQAPLLVLGLFRFRFHSTQMASMMLWWVQKMGSRGEWYPPMSPPTNPWVMLWGPASSGPWGPPLVWGSSAAPMGELANASKFVSSRMLSMFDGS